MDRSESMALLKLAALSGSVASLASAGMLMLRGRRELDDAAAPLNGPSQWVWGRQAPYHRGFSARHTVLGFAIHHGAAMFWGALFAALRRRRVPVPAAAVTSSAVAFVVDYGLTPKRLQPGFEKRLSKSSLLLVYVAFAAGLAAAGLAKDARRS